MTEGKAEEIKKHFNSDINNYRNLQAIIDISVSIP